MATDSASAIGSDGGRRGRAESMVKARAVDGGPIGLRPIRPGDAAALASGFASLSPQSRYLRFHGAGLRLTMTDFRRLCRPARPDADAWIAVDLLLRRPVAVGRYVRCTDRPDAAEIALTVCDAHQRRGIGRLLVSVLATAALPSGIGSFVASFLPGNQGAERLCERLGIVSTNGDGGLVVGELDLATLLPGAGAPDFRREPVAAPPGTARTVGPAT